MYLVLEVEGERKGILYFFLEFAVQQIELFFKNKGTALTETCFSLLG